MIISGACRVHTSTSSKAVLGSAIFGRLSLLLAISISVIGVHPSLLFVVFLAVIVRLLCCWLSVLFGFLSVLFGFLSVFLEIIKGLGCVVMSLSPSLAVSNFGKRDLSPLRGSFCFALTLHYTAVSSVRWCYVLHSIPAFFGLYGCLVLVCLILLLVASCVRCKIFGQDVRLKIKRLALSPISLYLERLRDEVYRVWYKIASSPHPLPQVVKADFRVLYKVVE